MLIRLLKAWGTGAAGAVVNVDDWTGAMLVRKKIGTAEAAVEAAVAPPAPEKAVQTKVPRR